MPPTRWPRETSRQTLMQLWFGGDFLAVGNLLQEIGNLIMKLSDNHMLLRRPGSGTGADYTVEPIQAT